MEDQHQPRPPTLSLHETIRTVQQLSSGKAPASDASSAEVCQHDCPKFVEHLTALFQEMWRQGEVAQDFKDTTIIHLYKRKGNRQVCDNHRGICLLNIAEDEEWNAKVRARPHHLPAPSPTSGSLDSLLTPGPGLPAKSFHRQPHISEDDNRAAFYHCRRLVQQRLREMQNERTARKAKEIQGHRHRPPAPWKTNTNLDLPFSLHETIRTVQQISSVKAPTSDSAPAEVYKHDGPKFMEHLTALFQAMWHHGEVPQNFKGATIIYLYKRIGNRQNNHLDQGLLSNSQCGFGSYRGPMDRIFAARQLQEKCLEMRTHLYSNFVDLPKAFDTVNREGLWRIMQKFSCPEQFIEMGRQLYDGMIAPVTDNGAVSEAFAVINGVKQGCALAPTLFSLMFSAMLMDAYRDH
ncbi:hypothetical protein SprV_1002857600 [Sparganum proliferum]